MERRSDVREPLIAQHAATDPRPPSRIRVWRVCRGRADRQAYLGLETPLDGRYAAEREYDGLLRPQQQGRRLFRRKGLLRPPRRCRRGLEREDRQGRLEEEAGQVRGTFRDQ